MESPLSLAKFYLVAEWLPLGALDVLVALMALCFQQRHLSASVNSHDLGGADTEGRGMKWRKKISGSDGPMVLGAGGAGAPGRLPGGRALHLLAVFSLPTHSVVFTLSSCGGSWEKVFFFFVCLCIISRNE